jgi:secondary thiamine-phosphate synthase enzyme
MKILRHRIELATIEAIQILDITGQVRDWVAASGIRDGLLTLISPHTTARVNVNEREPQLQRDMITYLKRLVPRDGDWLHNLATVDDRDNAHSHLLGLFMNSSETIPVAGGELVLGSWQSIFFIELDGPRERRGLELQILGRACSDDVR